MFLRICLTLLCAAQISFSAATFAQNNVSEHMKRSLNNLQHELLICSAFYLVSAVGMERLSDPSLAQKQEAAFDLAWNFAAKIGKEIDQKPEAMQARIMMAVADMKSEMDGNYVNYSIILQKYAEPCARKVENPARRLEEIIATLPVR